LTTTKVAVSLGAFVALYATLAVVDFWLMRHYARLDPPDTGPEAEARAAPLPAPGY
jgi:cytochrome bd-type quinol oxidase subunit 1